MRIIKQLHSVCRERKAERMNIICFGDSNTYGYDPRGYFGGRYDADCRWVDIVAEKTGWTVRNMGQNGQEIPSSAPPLPADTDLLIVMLGTNDLLQGRSPEQAAGRLERFLSGISLDRSKLLLVAPPPVALGEWVPSNSSSTTPAPLPGSARPWRSGWASALLTPESGTSPWPMTASTSPSRATGPLPLDFWRNSDETTAAEVIPEMDSTVLVYCRSGNRSKTAAALAELGYTAIYEFGGINTWPYETEP